MVMRNKPRRRGRADFTIETPKTEHKTVRLPLALCERVDRWRRKAATTIGFSSALRALVVRGLGKSAVLLLLLSGCGADMSKPPPAKFSPLRMLYIPFVKCMDGPGRPITDRICTFGPDFDGDGDVDLADWAVGSRGES